MGQPTVMHPGRRSSAEVAANSERRAEIKAIAAEIFARKGFQNTTVREIADAAGILSGSLYHHFDSKEAIVDEILSSFVNDLLADYTSIVEAGDDPVATLRNMVRYQFRTLVQNRAAITTARNDAYYLRRLPRLEYLDDTDVQVAELWTGVLQRGIDEGRFRADLDPALLWAFIRGAVWGTVEYQGRDAGRSTDELADAYLETLLGGIAA
jgi:AcrR family transcriptional regulator